MSPESVRAMREAAVVLLVTGSLDTAADKLAWAGYQVPRYNEAI